MSAAKLKRLIVEYLTNEEQIKEISNPLYEKRNELVSQIVPLAIKVKGIECPNGMLEQRIELNFKGGEKFLIKPTYLKADGTVKSSVFKVCGIPLFEIVEKK